MTTPSTPRKAGPLLGTGAQTAWPFTFKVFAEEDIAVTIADAAGVETALVLGVDYSVALNANQETSPGGTVTYPISGDPLPADSVLVIVGDIDYDQPLDIPSGGNFSPLALENQLDRATMQIQQLKEAVDRAAKMPVTYSLDDIEDFTAGVIALADNVDDIVTVANNIASVTAVATNEANVNIVAGSIDDVSAVANSTEVAVVAADLGGIRYTNDLGLITDPVAGPGASAPGAIATVAINIADVQTVAGVSGGIPAVATAAADIPAVAAVTAEIVIVADNVADVTNFADVYQGASATDPTLRNDSSALQAGDLYFNTATDMMRAYGLAGWVDSVVPENVTITSQTFSGDDVTTTFALSSTPRFEAACDVYISGVAQRVNVDYNIVDDSLNFVVAPPSGTDNIYVKVLSSYVGAVPPDGSITSEKLAATLDLGVLA